jgi:large subunit ribosomal protein L20
MRGMRYSQLIAGLVNARVSLDRKSLSEIAIRDPETFTKIVELARKHQPVGLK